MPEGDLRGGCCGRCCERFTLPLSPLELNSEYRKAAAFSRGERVKGKVIKDIEFWTPHLIYLGIHPFDPADGKRVYPPKHHYTCALFDRDHRLCRAYEHRPQACRDYPYGLSCRYDGCTLPDPGEELGVEEDLHATCDATSVHPR